MGRYLKALAVKTLVIVAVALTGCDALLLQAARQGHTESIRALIAAGADVNAKGTFDVTPLHVAATGGHAAAVRVLEAAGA